MATMLEQFGGEGFDDYADLIDRTSFGELVSSAQLSSLTVLGTANEQWVATRYTSPTNLTGLRRPLQPSEQVNNSREVEISFALYFSAAVNTPTEFVVIGTGADYANLVDKWSLVLIPNAGSGLTNEIGLRVSVDSNSSTTPTGILVQAGSLMYVTLRLRGESEVLANDGAIELFIDGTLVATQTNQDWSGIADRATFDGVTDLSLYITGTQTSIITYYRNVTLWDGWSTADGVAPPIKHVQDMLPTAVTSPDFTNEGGAVDTVTALSDSDDTTFLATATPAAELTIDVVPDPTLATNEVADVFTRLRASKATGGANTISIDVIENTGSTSLATETQQLTVVGPLRQDVAKALIPSATVLANDFSIKITNGS